MRVGSMPSLLVVSLQLGVNSLAELIAKAKQQKLTYGSAGPGTTMNIALEMLNDAAGVKITHVPYRGAAPALNDLLGGHVDMLNADMPVLLPLVKAGSIKALALFAPERSPLLPDLPTTKELGLPSVVMRKLVRRFPARRHAGRGARQARKGAVRRHRDACRRATPRRQRHARPARSRRLRGAARQGIRRHGRRRSRSSALPASSGAAVAICSCRATPRPARRQRSWLRGIFPPRRSSAPFAALPPRAGAG